MRVRHHWAAADATHEARFDVDVQDHAEHRQPRPLHQGTTHEALQRLPQDQLWIRTEVRELHHSIVKLEFTADLKIEHKFVRNIFMFFWVPPGIVGDLTGMCQSIKKWLLLTLLMISQHWFLNTFQIQNWISRNYAPGAKVLIPIILFECSHLPLIHVSFLHC